MLEVLACSNRDDRGSFPVSYARVVERRFRFDPIEYHAVACYQPIFAGGASPSFQTRRPHFEQLKKAAPSSPLALDGFEIDAHTRHRDAVRVEHAAGDVRVGPEYKVYTGSPVSSEYSHGPAASGGCRAGDHWKIDSQALGNFNTHRVCPGTQPINLIDPVHVRHNVVGKSRPARNPHPNVRNTACPSGRLLR